MSTRGASRWDENVQYYNYTSDTLRREPWSDEYVVAEAFIYDMNKEEVTTAITVVASGSEMDRMPRDEAIRRGEMVCDEAVAQYRVRREGVLIVPQLPAPSPAMLRYDLAGRLDAKAGRFAVKKTEAHKLLVIAVLVAVVLVPLIAILAFM